MEWKMLERTAGSCTTIQYCTPWYMDYGILRYNIELRGTGTMVYQHYITAGYCTTIQYCILRSTWTMVYQRCKNGTYAASVKKSQLV